MGPPLPPAWKHVLLHGSPNDDQFDAHIPRDCRNRLLVLGMELGYQNGRS